MVYISQANKASAATPATAPSAIPTFAPVFSPVLVEVAGGVVAAGAAKVWAEVEDEGLVRLGVEPVDAGDSEVEVLVVELELAEAVVVGDPDDPVNPETEAIESSVEYASASSQVTLWPRVAGSDMMFFSTAESENATVLELSSGHQHGKGVVTVSLLPSSHATH